MQFGIRRGVSVLVEDAKPALIVYAPLSRTRVRAGGGGPEDFVRRWPTIIYIEEQYDCRLKISHGLLIENVWELEVGCCSKVVDETRTNSAQKGKFIFTMSTRYLSTH